MYGTFVGVDRSREWAPALRLATLSGRVLPTEPLGLSPFIPFFFSPFIHTNPSPVFLYLPFFPPSIPHLILCLYLSHYSPSLQLPLYSPSLFPSIPLFLPPSFPRRFFFLSLSLSLSPISIWLFIFCSSLSPRVCLPLSKAHHGLAFAHLPLPKAVLSQNSGEPNASGPNIRFLEVNVDIWTHDERVLIGVFL